MVVLDWAYGKGQDATYDSMVQSEAYSSLLAEYNAYRKAKGDEELML